MLSSNSEIVPQTIDEKLSLNYPGIEDFTAEKLLKTISDLIILNVRNKDLSITNIIQISLPEISETNATFQQQLKIVLKELLFNFICMSAKNIRDEKQLKFIANGYLAEIAHLKKKVTDLKSQYIDEVNKMRQEVADLDTRYGNLGATEKTLILEVARWRDAEKATAAKLADANALNECLNDRNKSLLAAKVKLQKECDEKSEESLSQKLIFEREIVDLKRKNSELEIFIQSDKKPKKQKCSTTAAVQRSISLPKIKKPANSTMPKLVPKPKTKPKPQTTETLQPDTTNTSPDARVSTLNIFNKSNKPDKSPIWRDNSLVTMDNLISTKRNAPGASS